MNRRRSLSVVIAMAAAITFSAGPGSTRSAALSDQRAEELRQPPAVSRSMPMKKFAACADSATTVAAAALSCLEKPPKATPSAKVTLKFHLDPNLHPSVAARIRQTAKWALPYFNGYFTRLNKPSKIHIIVPLSSTWCGGVVAAFDYGDPTAQETANSYLCGQDGGANAGHARTAATAFVVVRPHSSLVTDFKKGDGEALDEFYYSLVAAEMGHASRGLLMEAYTGELGGQPYWPIWAQYMGNEILRYLADIRAGTSVGEARADRVWWMCERRATWNADYNDKRLISWETGSGGIYGCPTNDSADDAPNHYNMAFMAGEYLVAKHGLRWLLETFMAAPLKTRSGPGVRDLTKAAQSLGYRTWRQLEVELNKNMRAVLGEYGATLPK